MRPYAATRRHRLRGPVLQLGAAGYADLRCGHGSCGPALQPRVLRTCAAATGHAAAEDVRLVKVSLIIKKKIGVKFI